MKFIPNGVTRKLGRQILLAKKNSPRVMFVGGIAGVGVSTVMACRATLKLSDQLDKMKMDLAEARLLEDAKLNNPPEAHAVAKAYAKNAVQVAKLYGPAAVVGGISIGALTGSHVTLTRRNAGLTAAYAAMAKAYDEYRERIKEQLGEEEELDIYHASRTEKSKNEDGKLEEFKVAAPDGFSPYARFFDENSRNFKKNADLNRYFIKAQQNYANHLLQARGHVFLNEIYDSLGFEHSQAGAVVGWVLGPDGDNFIDFGMYEAVNNNFQQGWERVALLDFNVDGVIFDKI